MSKPYSILREKMKPAARKKAAGKTKALLDAMPLQELRHSREYADMIYGLTIRCPTAPANWLRNQVSERARI